jgi:DNA polymerase III delta prime subunit
MEANHDQFLWVEKYRPHSIDDCILPDEMKTTFKQFVAKGEIPNMLLCGGAGMGKTTIAKALCEELKCDYIVINASMERNIDTLRNEIKGFASTVSFVGKTKVVILDEADYLNPQSTQPALRGFIEEFSKNCRFIFTCNYKNKIIPALHSRTTVVEFKLAKSDRPVLAGQFFKRVQEIIAAESVTCADPKILAKLIERHFPDYRRILNELQRYSVSGTIDEGILVNLADVNVKELTDALKTKEWKKMRQWVVNNIDADPATIFRKLYDSLTDQVDNVPQLVLLLADYQYKAAFVADAEINLVACLTEIMAAVKFK